MDLDDDLTSGTNVWTCERCTLINISSRRRCVACDHRRLAEASVSPFVKAARDISTPTTTTFTMINNKGHNNNQKRSCNPENKSATRSKQLKLNSVVKESECTGLA